MKLLGLLSKIKIGNSVYVVSKIDRKGLSLTDTNKKVTVFELGHVIENLENGVMRVDG